MLYFKALNNLKKKITKLYTLDKNGNKVDVRPVYTKNYHQEKKYLLTKGLTTIPLIQDGLPMNGMPSQPYQDRVYIDPMLTRSRKAYAQSTSAYPYNSSTVNWNSTSMPLGIATGKKILNVSGNLCCEILNTKVRIGEAFWPVAVLKIGSNTLNIPMVRFVNYYGWYNLGTYTHSGAGFSFASGQISTFFCTQPITFNFNPNRTLNNITLTGKNGKNVKTEGDWYETRILWHFFNLSVTYED